MTDVRALLGELQKSDPKFDEAQSVINLVRNAGDMLERMRERNKWSQTQLAERLGITTGRVSQLESGTLRNAPSLKMLARFAHACGETVTLGASTEVAAQAEIGANINLSDIMRELIALRKVTLGASGDNGGEEKLIEDMNAALQQERMERARVEGALKAARKDNMRLHREVSLLRSVARRDSVEELPMPETVTEVAEAAYPEPMATEAEPEALGRLRLSNPLRRPLKAEE